MPRFVVLRHQWGRRSHWDWMFEVQEVLRTWSTDRIPEPGESVPARRIADHRLTYLDYEGPVSRQRGHVKRFAAGTYCLLQENTAQNTAHWVVELEGDPLSGIWELRDPASKNQNASPMNEGQANEGQANEGQANEDQANEDQANETAFGTSYGTAADQGSISWSQSRKESLRRVRPET